MCERCYIFIHDFLGHPPPHTSPFSKLVKMKKMNYLRGVLAKEFHTLISSYTHVEEYCMMAYMAQIGKKKDPVFDTDAMTNLVEMNISTEELIELMNGFLRIKAIERLKSKESIHYLLSLFQDYTVLKEVDYAEFWLASLLQSLWIHVKEVHKEHLLQDERTITNNQNELCPLGCSCSACETEFVYSM